MIGLCFTQGEIALAQLDSGNWVNTNASSGNQWKGVPKNFPVTRWPEESEIRPTPFDQWQQSMAPAKSLETKSIMHRDPIKGIRSRGLFVIIVNTDLQVSIQASLDQYITDLALDGFEIELIAASGGTVQEFRSFLYTKYLEGMQGAILIGDLPIAWYEITCWEWVEHEEFPCDLYYMDLDGDWNDGDGDGMFDLHSGEVDPEIWIGRLTASPMHINGVDETTLINNYFRKNHLYRIGQLPLANRALLYVDDDWQYSADYWGEAVSMVYPDTTVVFDPYETTAPDYENHLSLNYEMIQVCAHSDPLTHYFSKPAGDGGATPVQAMVSIDPRAVFYNLFACSNARYIERDYMAGWYIFCQTFGLASVGSTKTGSMLNFHDFYEPFGSGSSFGEAFAAWFSAVVWEDLPDGDICWFYGMTLCGDPTLRPGMSACPGLISHYLSDAAGDDDGILEAGETIECLFAMSNDGAATASGVSINLSINDASIIIIDGSAEIGDIAPGSVGTNESDSLKFEIPPDYTPRVDSLYLEIVWNGGTCYDTAAIEKALGGAEILLVDDEYMADIDKYYREYLDNSFIPYNVWDNPDSAIQPGNLNEYDVVVWFTGLTASNLLDGVDLMSLMDYLDNGGRLFLSGQGIAAQLHNDYPVFLHDYLKSDYLSTSYIPILVDVPGGQVFDSEDSLCITGAGGPYYQTDANQIAAINGGMVELDYITVVGAGAVSYLGSYRTVFFSFGFESILNGASRWIDRDSIYADILDFFEYGRPVGYPEVLHLSVSPGDPLCLTNHTPDISWVYSDAGSNPQTMFHFQVGSDNFWNIAEMWNHGPISSSDAVIAYNGLPLEDGNRYYLRVRVSNGSLWSDWSTEQICFNSIPVPTGLTPADMQAVENVQPGLTHYNMTDTEGSPLVYSYELYDDELLTTVVASAEDQPPDVGATSTWEIPVILMSNEDYYWRARAKDTLEFGEWSEPASFVVFPEYMCGDANADEEVNVGDGVYIISYVFKGGSPPDPVCIGDANGDGDTNVGDAVYLISYIFRGGSPPVETCCR
jgi:hypothetical protein